MGQPECGTSLPPAPVLHSFHPSALFCSNLGFIHIISPRGKAFKRCSLRERSDLRMNQFWPFFRQYAFPLVWYTDQDLDVDYKKFKNVSFSVNFGKEYYYIKKHLKILFPLQYILKGDELPST